MIKITKKELEAHIKDFQKIKENINNIEQKLKEQIGKVEKKIDDQFNKLDQKFTDKISELILMLDNRIEEFDQNIKTLTNNFKDKVKYLSEDISNLESKLEIYQENIENQINNKDEILTDMIKKFDEQFSKDKRKIEGELENIKGEQDVLKISYTVNEKQLLEKIEAMIISEISNACSDKEHEILMNVWIKELKDIIHDFEKLKKMNPQEFNIKLNEIVNIIELFKQKIVK